MADLVRLTIDGMAVEAPPGELVINAAKRVGIEIPAFCYYPGLALQASCRMCLVEVEKASKLLTACTLTVAEGMVVTTDSPAVKQARKSMLEFLLTNHPLDCPVCDKGGECELQDLTFRYGAGSGRFSEVKHHVDEKRFSPIVYFDAPRCILCYRCVRICDEGLGVKALGVVNRGVRSEIGPNRGDHLECDECGACIDICPVGALTSQAYRYQTRPWEMRHVGTVCAHCSNGCTTTLGVRGNQIIRANNRDRSGLNDEFLCIKGRFGFDFVHHAGRLLSPLMRVDGELKPAPWSQALAAVARKFSEIKARGGKFGVLGSNHTTNEENRLLAQIARQGLGTANIDHHRTGDLATFLALNRPQATVADLYNTPAALVVGADLAQQHPLYAFQLRANWRHHQARVYTVTEGPVREDQYSAARVRAERGAEWAGLESLAAQLKTEAELVILFGDVIQGQALRRLAAFGDGLGIPVKYVCLVDYSNSRGAVEAGLVPGPGPGLTLAEMLAAEDLDALWVVGANPLKSAKLAARDAFVVVQELFLTETARRADVVLPAASAYEKTGTVTSGTGEVQTLKQGPRVMGAKPDLEILKLLARQMALELTEVEAVAPAPPGVVASARDTLFTSGTLGRYSEALQSVMEHPGGLYR